MRRMLLLSIFSIGTLSACAGSLDQGEAEFGIMENGHGDHPNLWTGIGMGIGGVLFPSVNFTTAFGTSTADDPASLAVGHHDPDREGWTIQNVELSLEARLGAQVHAVVLYAAKIDLDDHWDDHFEEYYLTIDKLSGGLRIRAGRFYTAFGFQNDRHPHEFDWADQYLMNGRFMGDDALTVHGAEVSLPLPWVLPVGWSDRLTFSMGMVPDAEDHEHDHGGASDEPEFEPEGALLQDWLANVNYTARYEYSENHRFTAGVSAAFGKNNFERKSQIYGLQLEYQWLESGPDEGGRWFVWRTEFALRRFTALAEDRLYAQDAAVNGDEHYDDETHGAAEHEPESRRSLRCDFTDAGLYTTILYGWSKGLAMQARAEWVSGTAEAGLDERWRLSPGITWRPTERLDLLVRAQYNFDHSSAFGDAHSAWTQFVVGWGGGHPHEH